MMAIALTYDELKALKPCTDSLRRVARLMGGAKKWDGKKIDAASARKAGATYDDLVWAASEVARNNPDVERRLRLWLADCAVRVLYIYEADPQADGRPRNAIVVARQFARGEASAAARAAASDAAWAAWTASFATSFATSAAAMAARDAASAAAGAAAMAAWAARAAASAAARAAASDAASAAEESWQYDRLIAWLGDSEPEDWPLPDRPAKQQAA